MKLPLLLQGDCLELMKLIPTGSVDMVLADPPYGTTACKWDSVIPFEPMWEQLKRVTKTECRDRSNRQPTFYFIIRCIEYRYAEVQLGVGEITTNKFLTG